MQFYENVKYPVNVLSSIVLLQLDDNFSFMSIKKTKAERETTGLQVFRVWFHW